MATPLLRSSLLRPPRPLTLIPRATARATSTAILKGTVNDPTTFPPPSKTDGSHHWAFERLLSASLIPLTGAAFVTGGTNYPVLDGILGMTLVVHSHIGFDQIVVDYVHTRKFPVLGQIAKWGLRAATAGVLVGVYQFNTSDIGLGELIRRTWHA